MSYVTHRVACIHVLGNIWMPNTECAQTITIDAHAEQAIKDRGDGQITRDAVEDWLGCHAGDFQSITDFSVDIGDVEIPWASEDSEARWCDAMFGSED